MKYLSAVKQMAVMFSLPSTRSDWSRAKRDAVRLERMIFIADPFQAKTLPVFESIYRYGRSFTIEVQS